MMHDVDDATLMQALRNADPRRESTHDDRARRRLEQSWRQAMAATPHTSPRQRTTGARGPTLQSMAATIMALVILTSGVLVSSIVTRRGEGSAPTTQQAGGVEGSYRAVQDADGVLGTFLVAGGQALLRPTNGAWHFSPAVQWRGFGDVTRMRLEQMMLDGDEMYLLISANEERQPRWYRYSGSRPPWPPGLAETPQPIFDEGTRGFERVDDEDADAKGLRRYTADADAADLDFLGWFSSTNIGTRGAPVATVDIWVDADGRVRRLEEARRPDPEGPSITRFDRFDAVAPIDRPYPEGAEAPVAEDVVGMVLYAYGDPAFADELRERLTAELNGDPDIAEFEIFERSAEDERSGPDLDSELFVAALRFTDDIAADVNAQHEIGGRFLGLSVGDVPANATAGDGPANATASPQGYAAIHSGSLFPWMTLDG